MLREGFAVARCTVERLMQDRIEFPRRQDRHDARSQLDVHELARCAPFNLNATRALPVQRMPAIVDSNILPDMGRMTARLL